MFGPAEIEVSYHLALVRTKQGVPMAKALGALQDAWDSPLAKADTTGGPGDHPLHPEIGRQELALYRGLTESQRAAMKDIADIVAAMYAANGGTFEGIDSFQIDESFDAWKARTMSELATHPLKAYLIGQSLATMAAADLQRRLGRGGNLLMRPVLPEDRKIVDFLTQYQFAEISHRFDDLKHELRSQLIGGIATGANPKEVARAMRNITQDWDTNFQLIAVTETARAETAGRLQEYLDQGYTRVIGSSAHDPKTCDHCLRLIDGKVLDIAAIVGQSNRGKKAADWGPFPPVHPACRCTLLPWTAELARAA